MPTLQVEHGVRDYDSWKAAFDSDPVGREAGGVRGYSIWRPVDDPAYVVVDLEFDTTREAEAFRDRLQALWTGAGASLGLQSPRARILEAVERTDY